MRVRAYWFSESRLITNIMSRYIFFYLSLLANAYLNSENSMITYIALCQLVLFSLPVQIKL